MKLIFLETGSHHIAQAVLEQIKMISRELIHSTLMVESFLRSSCLCLQSTGIKGVQHCIWPTQVLSHKTTQSLEQRLSVSRTETAIMACPGSQFVAYMYLFYALGPGSREEENNSRSQGLNTGHTNWERIQPDLIVVPIS